MRATFRSILFVSMLIVIFVQPTVAQWTQCAGLGGGYLLRLVDGGSVLHAACVHEVLTFDKGTQRWQASGSGLPASWVQDVATAGGNLLAGMANGDIYCSSDAGATWLRTDDGSGFNAFAVTTSAVYAAVGDKLLLKSTDNGMTWAEANTGLEGKWMGTIAVAGTGILAATNAGVFRSDDAGVSWAKIWDYGQIYSLFVDGGTIWAGGYQQVYRSTDDGAIWTMVAGSEVFPHDVLGFTRTATYLYACAIEGGISRSSDDGGTWEKVNTNLPDLRIYELVADGATVYAATGGGGMYALTEPGNAWVPRNAGMLEMNVRAIHPMGTSVFTATMGRGIMAASAADLDNWSEYNSGNPAPEVLRLAQVGEVLLAGTDDFGVYRSSDAGMSWIPASSGLTNGDIYSFFSHGTAVFAGTNSHGLFFSSDAGDTWTQRGASISNEVVYGITALGTKLFVATLKRGVLSSSDEGENWTPASEGIPGDRVNAIHAHGTSLFAGVSRHGTYRSTDEGVTWTRLGGAIDGFVAETFLSIGTQLLTGTSGGGLFRSIDDGETWVAVNDGLDDGLVNSLAVHGDMLLAGLQYAGVWRRPLSEIVLDVADAATPQTFRLHPVSPQPLRDRGTARFDLEAGTDVRLDVFDLLGRQVATAVAARYEAGSHAVAFDVSGLRAGSYLLRLQAGGEQATQRVTVIR